MDVWGGSSNFREGWGLQRRIEDSEWGWVLLRGNGDLKKGFGGTKQGGKGEMLEAQRGGGWDLSEEVGLSEGVESH